MLRLRCLGGAAVESDRGSLPELSERRHALALLAVLATAPGHTASRGKLVGLLWPDASERAARNRLNTCVHYVRSILGKDALISAGDDLRLNPGEIGSDVDEFRRALDVGDRERAVTLYRGAFLDGFGLKDSPEFEKWLDRERDRHRRRFRETLESLAEDAERRGDFEDAVRWWRRRANDDRYDSRVARRLMEALTAAGNPAAALRVGEVHRALLEKELGLATNAGIPELMERLRSGEELSGTRGGTAAGAAKVDASEHLGPGPSTARPAPSGTQAQAAAEPEGAEPEGGAFEAAEDGATGPVDTVSAPLGAKAESSVRLRDPSRLALVGLVTVGVVGAAIAGLWHLLGAGAPGPGGSEHDLVGFVAVLPFETIGRAEPSSFTRGIQLGVMTRLSNIAELGVLSEQSVERLGAMEEPTRVAAARLGVDWIVRGDVQEAGDRVQVNVRLVDADRDRQVWAETHGAALTAEELFEVQAEIAGQIARALRLRLTPAQEARLASVPTENTAAYELYLQARDIFRTWSGPAEGNLIDAQIELYRRALALDQTFADAWAWLAIAFVGRGFRERDPAAWADSAFLASRRAIDLNPELADAHVALGAAHWLVGDVERGMAAHRRALELQPTHPTASNLAIGLSRDGRIAESMRLRERSHRLSPIEDTHILGLATSNDLIGRRAIADAWLDVARERGHSTLRTEADRAVIERRFDRARLLLDSLAAREEGVAVTRRRAALALYEGDWREARRLYGSLYPGHPYASSPVFLGLLWDPLGLAWAHRELGDEAEARGIAEDVVREATERLEHGVAGRGEHIEHRLAVAHLLLGDTTAALDHLERPGLTNIRFLPKLESLPLLDPLREHPRFRALIDRLRRHLADERRKVEEGGWGVPPGWSGAEDRAGRAAR